jgi:hypothetical protein
MHLQYNDTNHHVRGIIHSCLLASTLVCMYSSYYLLGSKGHAAIAARSHAWLRHDIIALFSSCLAPMLKREMSPLLLSPCSTRSFRISPITDENYNKQEARSKKQEARRKKQEERNTEKYKISHTDTQHSQYSHALHVLTWPVLS